MNYEQKYKEALERARSLHKDALINSNSTRAKHCELIFPELKENEDERIRILLIKILAVNHPNGYFKVNPANTLHMEAISTEELISWLKSLKPKL